VLHHVHGQQLFAEFVQRLERNEQRDDPDTKRQRLHAPDALADTRVTPQANDARCVQRSGRCEQQINRH
jgi:hypothetical protein